MSTLTSINYPYASVLVAVYEPMLLKWLSGLALTDLRVRLMQRRIPARPDDELPVFGGTDAPTVNRFRWRPDQPRLGDDSSRTGSSSTGLGAGRSVAAAPQRASSIPSPWVAREARALDISDDEQARRVRELDEIFSNPAIEPIELIKVMTLAKLPHLVGSSPEHVLSPVGIAHLYRQLYFDAGAGLGPLEQAFSIAPKEELEVVQEMARRDSIERTEAFGSESTLENSREESTVEEISDHVQAGITRDMTPMCQDSCRVAEVA